MVELVLGVSVFPCRDFLGLSVWGKGVWSGFLGLVLLLLVLVRVYFDLSLNRQREVIQSHAQYCICLSKIEVRAMCSSAIALGSRICRRMLHSLLAMQHS